MSRAITLALSHIEARKFALPGFEALRSAVARATQVDVAASEIYAENQAIRSSSRGWML
jgi:hypothetical protein